MGFDEDSARAALSEFKDVQRAIIELMRVGGVAPPSWMQTLIREAAISPTEEGKQSLTNMRG